MDEMKSLAQRVSNSPDNLFKPRRLNLLGLTALCTLVSTANWCAGADLKPTAEQAKFFEKEVRPLLVANCLKCHGPEKQKGGLRLDSRTTILSGGETGPAVVEGKPEESLLVEAINYDGLEMPPQGKLGEKQRETLIKWVQMGLPWPGDTSSTAPVQAAKPKITDEDREFWSFQPLQRPEVPQVAGDWIRNPIDHFILARLNKEGLAPATEEGREALIRRLSYDLSGLPPTPAEIDAFINDKGPNAYETVVDRLLASPRYGERWGRHWLDLVRYAESDGYRADAYRPDAWRYRDYVVKAFNDDKPYDQFVTEQLAGDELRPNDPEMRVAVGYYRLGTYEYNQRDVPGQWATIINEITDVTGDVFLGLGMGCARCHDHKFDPILQKDYYRLQAFFTPLLPRDDLNLATANQWKRYQKELEAWEVKVSDTLKKVAELEAPYREKAKRSAIEKFPPEMQAIIAKPKSERTPLEEQLAALAYRQVIEEYNRLPAVMKKSKVKDTWQALQDELDRNRPTPPGNVMTATDIGATPPPTLIPGDRKKEVIKPGFLTLLDPEPAVITKVSTAPESTGRRTALARWLTRPDNQLTTRVAANRIWQYHFGRGLVDTSSDFGKLGERPSHPELLDWLASEFVARGWSLKALHRLIVTSATYRQAAHHPDPALAREKDPENRLLWHRLPRRLDVEPIRDAMLAVSGELDLTGGGPATETSKPRRAIYTQVIRNKRDPLSEVFDSPDGSLTTPKRDSTVTALQALLMINGSWTLDRSKAFAARLQAEADDDGERVERAYRLAFGRRPSDPERADALAFLHQGKPRPTPNSPRDEVAEDGGAAGACDTPPADSSSAQPQANPEAWVDFCHALLNASEFLYVD